MPLSMSAIKSAVFDILVPSDCIKPKIGPLFVGWYVCCGGIKNLSIIFSWF